AEELNSFWMASSFSSTVLSCAGSFTSQSFCGLRRMRAPFAPPRLSEPERRCRRPGGGDELRHRKARAENLRLQRGDILLVDERVADGGDRVLPDQSLLRHERAEIVRDRTHVAMRELEPRAGKRVRELIRVLVETPRDLFVSRVQAEREVGGQHGRDTLLRFVEGVRN